ncbi:MAG: MATE family efflux transporter [Clostridium sp.]
MDKNLGKDFTFFSLIKFVAPSIIMMVFMSLYTMVDGAFVSRFVSTDALSAVNIVFPLYSTVIALAIMLSAGSSAIIAKKLGENKIREAQENFTFIIIVGIVIGFAILISGLVFLEPLVNMLGATPNIFDYCMDYGRTMLIFMPFAMLQMLFQNLFVTAGKPNLGLCATVFGGAINVALDYIFVVKLGLGVSGAALATGIGMVIPAIIGVVFFAFFRNSSLHFVKPKYDFKMLIDACLNGSSEMVTNISIAIVTLLFNLIMLKHLGEDGVAAITIILYAQFILNAIFFGFSMGVAPIISYNYGSLNHIRQKKIFKYCITFIGTFSILIYLISIPLSPILTEIFSHKGSKVYDIALEGFRIFNLSFLFNGLNIYASTMFTAYSNGKISALLSFIRTFVLISGALIILPNIIGVTGAWLATVVAEFISFFISIYFIRKYKTIYSF